MHLFTVCSIDFTEKCSYRCCQSGAISVSLTLLGEVRTGATVNVVELMQMHQVERLRLKTVRITRPCLQIIHDWFIIGTARLFSLSLGADMRSLTSSET